MNTSTKTMLASAGASRAMLERPVPPSAYEMPSDPWFEPWREDRRRRREELVA